MVYLGFGVGKDSDDHNDNTMLMTIVTVMRMMLMMVVMMMTMMMMMVTQHIPTSQIPTRWESDIMMKGGNMTQSNSHHTHI